MCSLGGWSRWILEWLPIPHLWLMVSEVEAFQVSGLVNLWVSIVMKMGVIELFVMTNHKLIYFCHNSSLFNILCVWILF